MILVSTKSFLCGVMKSFCSWYLKVNNIKHFYLGRIIDGAETRESKFRQGEIFGRSITTDAHEYNVIATGKEVSDKILFTAKLLKSAYERC